MQTKSEVRSDKALAGTEVVNVNSFPISETHCGPSLEMNPHLFDVKDYRYTINSTSKLGLASALHGDIPEECDWRKCAKSLVSFDRKSPKVGTV